MRLDSWTDEAACKGQDTDLFFIETYGSYRPMITDYCAHCPVRQDCLDYAIRLDIRDGLWGGLSPHERRRYKRSAAGRRAAETRSRKTG